MARRMNSFVIALSVALLGHAASAAVIYVDDSAGGGANDGSSWANAFTDLHDALAAAQSGDEIRIGEGTYKPAAPPPPPLTGSQSETFSVIDGLAIIGGYAGAGAANPDDHDPQAYPTILSGDLNGDDQPDFTNRGDNSMHVMTLLSPTGGEAVGVTLRGLTIRDGEANGLCSNDEDCSGGGILLKNAVLLTVDECTIEWSRARVAGGGVGTAPDDDAAIVLSNSRVRHNRCINFFPSGAAAVGVRHIISMIDCVFFDNHGAYSGGVFSISQPMEAIRCEFLNNGVWEDGGVAFIASDAMFRDCVFSGNGAGYYGTVWVRQGHSTFENCVFESNQGYIGGCIAIDLQGSAQIVRSRFIQNTSSIAGAIYNRGILSVSNSSFIGNTTNWNNGYNGGAIANHGTALLTNCLFSGNAAGFHGGVLYSSGNAMLSSCTIVGNREHLGPSGAIHHQGGSLTIHNSLIWANIASNTTVQGQQIHSQNRSLLSITNSNVQGWDGSLGGANNTASDPMFIDADGPDNIYGTIDDNARLMSTSPAIDSGDNAALPADSFDLDGDGDTTEPTPLDLDDHRRIVNRIIDRGAYEFQACAADIAPLASQGDGSVGVADLLAVISSWGPCGGPPTCAADIAPAPQGDGTVGVADLLAVISSWGACP